MLFLYYILIKFIKGFYTKQFLRETILFFLNSTYLFPNNNHSFFSNFLIITLYICKCLWFINVHDYFLYINHANMRFICICINVFFLLPFQDLFLSFLAYTLFVKKLEVIIEEGKNTSNAIRCIITAFTHRIRVFAISARRDSATSLIGSPSY